MPRFSDILSKRKINMTTIDELDIWENDNDKVFRYEEIAHYLEGYSVEEIFAAQNDHTITNFNGLRIETVTDESSIYRIFITPDKKAFTFDSEMVTQYNIDDEDHLLDLYKNPELLKWLIQPAYLEEDLGLLDPINLWKMRWVGTEEKDFDTIRFPVKAEPYENLGYSLLAPKPYGGGIEYVSICAEIKVDNRLVHIAGANYPTHAWFVDEPLPADLIITRLNENEPSTHLGFLNKLKRDHPDYDGGENDALYDSSYYIPVESLPETLMTCQGMETPILGMKPVIHFPIDIRRFDSLHEGDSGSVLVYWDGKSRFHVEYTQT